MQIEVFKDVDRVWSRWHGQRCPLCKEGILADGVGHRTKLLSGVLHNYRQIAAWCGHCKEGIVIADPIEEVGMQDFLEAKRQFEQENLPVAA